MAKKNKKRSAGNVPLPTPRKEEQPEAPPTHPSHNAIRETLESLAIAFILAFLIRTFVVEPFVIPTGSMSPALQGVHKDLDCPRCGERYRVNASQEGPTAKAKQDEMCVGGMCPMCRYTMAYDKQLADDCEDAPKLSANEKSYSGDRIIVNKFLYSFSEPERWDVVVFKYPGSATQNYIKRLVGLPEETLRIFGGDLFVRPDGEEDFEIARKPPRVAYAMRQPVHDTDRNPTVLHEAGWPFRWQPEEGWQVASSEVGERTRRTFTSDASGEHWLRYSHTPPTKNVWPMLEQSRRLPKPEEQLISDFNPYNTRIPYIQASKLVQRQVRDPFLVSPSNLGMHWVGDLYVEANVEVEQSSGQLLLELVESGQRFRATIDLATGVATLNILPRGESSPASDFEPTGQTLVNNPGTYRLLFGNVDDQLRLWVNDKLVEFDAPTSYNWEERFGPLKDALPFATDDEPGDLAPARVGSRDARVVIDRLRVDRDIYYIAAKYDGSDGERDRVVSDYFIVPDRSPVMNQRDWDLIARRQAKEFPIAEDQFFVMGDNSPQSSDARLWNRLQSSRNGETSQPGGNYLERQLLIGRAVSVVWPHPWNYVVPGFTDMRRIQ